MKIDITAIVYIVTKKIPVHMYTVGIVISVDARFDKLHIAMRPIATPYRQIITLK